MTNLFGTVGSSVGLNDTLVKVEDGLNKTLKGAIEFRISWD